MKRRDHAVPWHTEPRLDWHRGERRRMVQGYLLGTLIVVVFVLVASLGGPA